LPRRPAQQHPEHDRQAKFDHRPSGNDLAHSPRIFRVLRQITESKWASGLVGRPM
jgi:hypothetical protein